MAYYVRKIMRSTSPNILDELPTDELSNISSDVATNEFRSSDSKLSVWYIDSLAELDKAILAIAMGGQKIEAFKLIVMESNIIDNNFTIECSPGKTAAFNLVDTHRDICGITYKTLFTLLTAYKNAVDNDKCHRCTAADLRRLAKEALMKNQIDIELAGDKLVKDLEGL